jgi:D-sedoheptulose 7-phosphate isomerase
VIRAILRGPSGRGLKRTEPSGIGGEGGVAYSWPEHLQMNDALVGQPGGAITAGTDGGGPPHPGRLEWLRPFTTRFVAEVTSALERLDIEAVDRVVTTLAHARDDGHVIFVAGNGGSAATASHWVNDLAKATRSAGLPYVRAISLTDSTPWMTALANDEGYERVFAGQLENMARPGDVLVVISASGNSPNLVRAVEYARANGVETMGLLGFDGGLLRTMVDHTIWIETPLGAYGLAENVHSVVCDLVTSCLAQPTSPYRGR